MIPDDTRRVEAVRTACAILDVLREVEEIGVTELADQLDMTKSSVHAHLVTLAESGYVVNNDGRYRLSLQVLDIAEHVKDTFGEYDVITEELERLAAETSEVAQFATEEHGLITYLAKAEGSNAVSTGSSVGRRSHMHCTSLGKAILCDKPHEEVETIIDTHGLPQRTPHTITDRDELFLTLERASERGYTVDNEENALGIRSIGTSVTGKGDDTLGAICITGPSSRITDERIEEVLEEAVHGSANIIEVNVKFS